MRRKKFYGIVLLIVVIATITAVALANSAETNPKINVKSELKIPQFDFGPSNLEGKPRPDENVLNDAKEKILSGLTPLGAKKVRMTLNELHVVLHDLDNFVIERPVSATDDFASLVPLSPFDKELFELDTPTLYFGATKTLGAEPPEYFRLATGIVPQSTINQLKSNTQESDRRINLIRSELESKGRFRQAADMLEEMNESLIAQLNRVRQIEDLNISPQFWGEFRNVHLVKWTADINYMKKLSDDEAFHLDLDLVQKLLEKGAYEENVSNLLAAKNIIYDLDSWLLCTTPPSHDITYYYATASIEGIENPNTKRYEGFLAREQ